MCGYLIQVKNNSDTKNEQLLIQQFLNNDSFCYFTWVVALLLTLVYRLWGEDIVWLIRAMVYTCCTLSSVVHAHASELQLWRCQSTSGVEFQTCDPLHLLMQSWSCFVGGANSTGGCRERVIAADDSRSRCRGASEGGEGDGNGRWRNGWHGRNGLLGNWQTVSLLIRCCARSWQHLLTSLDWLGTPAKLRAAAKKLLTASNGVSLNTFGLHVHCA